MANKNAFEGQQKATRPEPIPPQAWGDRTPRNSGLKTAVLADVAKLVVKTK